MVNDEDSLGVSNAASSCEHSHSARCMQLQVRFLQFCANQQTCNFCNMLEMT